ncbi:MAG: enolase C-terminal domain-like protein [Rhodothermales bacterium]|nr:enolase C-terminal domain-like protein [Rhodothermales bacterium]
MDRRELIKGIGLGAAASALGLRPSHAEALAGAPRGLPPVKITNVRAIATAPDGIELVVVKVETSEPGLYGLGCATFRQRAHSVVSAVNQYLNDFAVGRIADDIEDVWQSAYVSSYWRNGPVLNNALSGLDQALWDIKGKRAGMSVYQLLGGRCRFAVDTYAHAGGSTPEAVAEQVKGFMDQGFRHVRIQLGAYGAANLSGEPDFKRHGYGMPADSYMDRHYYLKMIPELFAHVREVCGDRVELLHDIHERLQPNDAINLVKALEPYRPFFIEDPFSPENIGFFRLLRQQTSVPLAMGELYNNPHEWIGPMSERLFDYIRIHISQIGGITPAMKVARLGEAFGVRTAWHGPGDVSPVGHAANAHIDLAVWNFGIQEAVRFSDRLREVFPGAPTMDNGYMIVNEAPGLGVDIDEVAAARYPIPEKVNTDWTQIRSHDGTPIRP